MTVLHLACLLNVGGKSQDLFQRLTVNPCSISALLLTSHGPHVLATNSTASLKEIALQ